MLWTVIWFVVVNGINLEDQAAQFRDYNPKHPVHVAPGIYQLILTGDLGDLYQNFLAIYEDNLIVQQPTPKLAWELVYLTTEDEDSNLFALKSTVNPENVEPYFHIPAYIAFDAQYEFTIHTDPTRAIRFQAFFHQDGYAEGKMKLKTYERGYFLGRSEYVVKPRKTANIWQIKHAFPYIPGVLPSLHQT